MTEYNPKEPERPWMKQHIKKDYTSKNYALYNSRRWRNFSKICAKEEINCRHCKLEAAKRQKKDFTSEDLRSDKLIFDSRILDGKISDHIIAIKAGGAIYDKRNIQRLCLYHDGVKRNEEKRGIIPDWKHNKNRSKIPK